MPSFGLHQPTGNSQGKAPEMRSRLLVNSLVALASRVTPMMGGSEPAPAWRLTRPCKAPNNLASGSELS